MIPSIPLISIITPIYNRAHIIQHTIESIIQQTYDNWEFILIDDGSTDEIEQFITEKYANESRIKFHKRNREPKSASTCRNIGIENATGDYLIFLDSDDLLESFCLEQRANVFFSEPMLDFAVFRFRYLNHEGNYVENNFDNGKEPLINFLSNKSYWNITCPIWKKSFLSSIGGFNPNFMRYQDIEMHIRAITQPDVNYKIFFELKPDLIIIPSVKKQSSLFALDVFASLQLLLPQTYSCLKKINKIHYAKFMEGYLKEWLKLMLNSNFDKDVCMKTIEVFDMFEKYRIISNIKFIYYKITFYVAQFFIEVMMLIYSKSI